MTGFDVRPEELFALRNNIDQRQKAIRERLDNLDAEVGKLRAAWSGEAQQSYDVAQAKWNKQIDQMNQILQNAGMAAEQIGQRYNSTDKRAAGRFAQ